MHMLVNSHPAVALGVTGGAVELMGGLHQLIQKRGINAGWIHEHAAEWWPAHKGWRPHHRPTHPASASALSTRFPLHSCLSRQSWPPVRCGRRLLPSPFTSAAGPRDRRAGCRAGRPGGPGSESLPEPTPGDRWAAAAALPVAGARLRLGTATAAHSALPGGQKERGRLSLSGGCGSLWGGWLPVEAVPGTPGHDAAASALSPEASPPGSARSGPRTIRPRAVPFDLQGGLSLPGLCCLQLPEP